MSDFITISDFCKEFEVIDSSIFVKRHYGTIPESAFVYLNKKDLLIDRNFFKRRKEFQMRITRYCQDMYYIVENTQRDAATARVVATNSDTTRASCVTYMLYSMFSPVSHSVLNYDIGRLLWAFARYYRQQERHLRRADPSFNIQHTLDSLMH